MNEVWKPISGFEDTYEVSNMGRVRSWRHWRATKLIMSPSNAGKGYRKVILCRPGEDKLPRYVHDIVLEEFVGPRPSGMEAAHGNGIRHDNRVANLRWDTRPGNFADKIAHGTHCCGEKHGRRKLTASDVLSIRTAVGTLREIGDYFGVGPMQVHRIKTRKNWGTLA